MPEYTVFLFRSGRVYVREGRHTCPADIQPPVLTETVEAQTEYAAMGKLLLALYDAANQPMQQVPVPESVDTNRQWHTDEHCSPDRPCLGCTQRIYGL